MTTATQAPSLRLNRLEVENFLRVKALQVDAEGHHVIISGPNGSGKTSAVDAIWSALGGKPGKEMPEPIHRGADRASVRLDLGEFIVERFWTEKGTRLVVTAQDGSKVAKPQQLLDGLLGKYALDPIAFLERRPVEQVDDVLQIAGVGPPVGDVMSITGEAHEPKPGESAAAYLERLIAEDTGLYYTRRREAHRELERKRAALEEQRQALDKAGGPIRPDEPEGSPSELLQQIEHLQAKADQRRAVQQTATAALAKWQEGSHTLDALEREQEQESKRRQELTSQILALTAHRSELEQSIAQRAARIENGYRMVPELKVQAEADQAAADALPDPGPKMAELRRQVQAVEQGQVKRMERQVHQQRLQALGAEAEAAASQHRTLDTTLEALRQLPGKLLAGIDMGVPGLEVGLGELRLNGVPFRQASQAERMATACAVAMRQRPKLRLLRVDEGERLDRHSRELLFRLADENDFQVVFTAVSDAEALRVEIVDKEPGA